MRAHPLDIRELPLAARLVNADAMDLRPTVMARCDQRREGPVADEPRHGSSDDVCALCGTPRPPTSIDGMTRAARPSRQGGRHRREHQPGSGGSPETCSFGAMPFAAAAPAPVALAKPFVYASAEPFRPGPQVVVVRRSGPVLGSRGPPA